MNINLEAVSCNLCGEDQTQVLFSQRDLLVDCDTEFSVQQCLNCGLVYVNPRPRVEDIHRFYPQNFFSYQLEALPPNDPSMRQRLVAYITQSSANQRVKTVRKLVNLGPQSKVLDLGCGKAAFLHALEEQVGCQVTGLDFDENSVRYCQDSLGLDVHMGGAQDVANLDRAFDLVTMWHFLEHDFDPAAALQSINRTLKPGQHLLLEVPNGESAENALFGKRSFLYDPPRHLYNFSPTTISGLLKGAGFEVESINFPHFSGGWIGTVQGLLTNGRIFGNLEKNVFAFMFLSVFCLPADLLCSLLGRGSIMTVLAKKVTEVSDSDNDAITKKSLL